MMLFDWIDDWIGLMVKDNHETSTSLALSLSECVYFVRAKYR